jgi:hypothetical protein
MVNPERVKKKIPSLLLNGSTSPMKGLENIYALSLSPSAVPKEIS